MLSQWWKLRSTVRAINSTLLQRGDIQVTKAKDHSKTNVHWYCFSSTNERFQKKVRGSGAGFSDRLGIVRAWGEFVERYSFRNTSLRDNSATTSNGFASHLNEEDAKAGALAELIERDVFLSCWLLKIPAKSFSPNTLTNQTFNLRQLQKLKQDGFNVQMGLFGQCMGLFVGIAAIYSDTQLVIATSAKASLEELAAHLTREAAITVSDLKSSQSPKPIEILSEDAEPIDHLKFYLSKSSKEFLADWFQEQTEERVFLSFNYSFENLTSENDLAQKTGYFVFRAKSKECQNLWFGTTRPQFINLDRLSQISGKQINYKELNHEPHPLA